MRAGHGAGSREVPLSRAWKEGRGQAGSEQYPGSPHYVPARGDRGTAAGRRCSQARAQPCPQPGPGPGKAAVEKQRFWEWEEQRQLLGGRTAAGGRPHGPAHPGPAPAPPRPAPQDAPPTAAPATPSGQARTHVCQVRTGACTQIVCSHACRGPARWQRPHRGAGDASGLELRAPVMGPHGPALRSVYTSHPGARVQPPGAARTALCSEG